MELSTAGRFTRRPVTGFTLYFMLGTCSGLKSDISCTTVLTVAAAFCLCAIICVILSARVSGKFIIPWFTTILIAGSFFFAAWGSAAISRRNQDQEWLRTIPAEEGDRIAVTGVVCGDPDVLPAADPRRGVAQFPLQLEQITQAGVTYPADKARILIKCYGNGAFDIPLYGERWRLDGKLSFGRTNSFKATVRPFLRVSFRDAEFQSGSHGWWLAERCYATRRAATGYLSAGLQEHALTVDVLQSLILGYRRLSYQMRQVFVFTGTLHIFAISGSHVVVMGAILIVILGMFRVSSVYWGVFLAPLLCMYTFATGMQSSAVRACIMAIIYWGAPLLGRKADSLTALSVSAFLIVAAVPSQLLDTGFILSVVCVLGLIVLFPIIHMPLQKMLEPDPLRLEPETKVITALRYAGRGLWSMVAMSISAWLVSAPLTAYYFGNFTPIGLLANLIVIPLSALVIMAGCLSLVLGSCVEWVGVTFNHANIVLVWLMVKPMEWLAKVPYGNIKIEAVPLWSLVVWYGFLAGWVVWRKGMENVEFGKQNAE